MNPTKEAEHYFEVFYDCPHCNRPGRNLILKEEINEGTALKCKRCSKPFVLGVEL